MNKMKFLFAVVLMGIGLNVANAQEEVTDEDLRRYALLNETIDIMKAEISVLVNDMIKNQEGMTGARYSELKKGAGEPASDFEQKFMDLVEGKIDERKEAIKTVNQILATKMMADGGKSFKAVKAALSSDENIKERYDDILDDMELSEGDDS